MTFNQFFSVDFRYPVIFTRGVFSLSNHTFLNVLDEGSAKIVFFVDEGLWHHWPGLEKSISEWCFQNRERIKQVPPVYPIKSGEAVKNDISILNYVGNIVEEESLCRQSYIVIIGGGAVLDAVSFAASLIHRGIRHIRLPTTVLSQLDSGVGVKNSINSFGQKNFYGTFSPPWAVINDLDFLQTLEQRDWISGISEAFKVAIIKDKSFLKYLSEKAVNLSNRDAKSIKHVLERCAGLHLEHIRDSGDPFEKGSAQPLDFGHWAAHRLEMLTGFELRHGEAVAIGIALDLHCAVELNLLDNKDCEYVLDAMERCGLKLWHATLELSSDKGKLEIIKGIEQFRVHQGGSLSLIMPNGIGGMTKIHKLPDEIIIRAIKLLKDRREKICNGKARILHTV